MAFSKITRVTFAAPPDEDLRDAVMGFLVSVRFTTGVFG
jgi:hypothetical protein